MGKTPKKKNELLKECLELITDPKVVTWYNKNLLGKTQYNTLKSLETAIQNNELTLMEALSIALITGVQWDVKFEGTR